MPKESLAQVAKRRLLGVLFIALVVALVSLSIAIYNKAFTTTVDVTLKADHTGNQLLLDSDVKERGIIVGSVTKVKSNGSNAIVTLALEPGRVKDIPANVTAQILPKTLFGEQYVALSIPDSDIADASAAEDLPHIADPIKAGDVIPQDRSKGALEAQDVLGDLLPLLTAVQPAELNSTLTAIATALHNRGAKLGQTLVSLDKYLKIINPHTQQLVDDLKKLGNVALEYNNVAPDIFDTLQNLQTSVKTVVERRVALDSLLTTGSTASDVLSSFLSDNRSRLINVTGQTNKVYNLLAEYSPEFTCLFAGIAKLDTLATQAVYNGSIHLSVVADLTNQGKYTTKDSVKIVTGYGPSCFGLPNPSKPFQIPEKYKCLNDGAALTDAACGASAAAEDTQAIGSPEENALVNTLIAGELGTTPNKVPGGATILAGPLLRGNEVKVK